MKTLEDAASPIRSFPATTTCFGQQQMGQREQRRHDEPFNPLVRRDPRRSAVDLHGSDATGLSQFHILEAEGQQFGVARSVVAAVRRDSREWAQSVLDAHPTAPVILSNHALLGVAAD